MAPSIFETSNQLWVFLFTVYGGIALGLLYDVLYIVRVSLGGSRVLTALLDVAYWLIATALAFGLLYYACEGEFRYYDALGFALGAGLWFWGPGKAARWAQRKIAKGLNALWRKFKLTRIYQMIAK
jgi:spore cortex biosynthesis protein YabQ